MMAITLEREILARLKGLDEKLDTLRQYRDEKSTIVEQLTKQLTMSREILRRFTKCGSNCDECYYNDDCNRITLVSEKNE